MSDRKRKSRGPLTRHIQFGDQKAAQRGAQLGRLTERAPGLEKNRKSTSIAMMGSLVIVLTVGGLYYSVSIYQRISENKPRDSTTVEVEPAPEIKPTPLKELIQKTKEQDEREAEEYQRLVEELKTWDLRNEENG